MLRLAPVKKLSTQTTSCAALQQALAQMRAEEAGAAGDQNALFEMHARSDRHECGWPGAIAAAATP